MLGTAISLWPNALNCLDTWGIGDDIANIGHPFDRIATRKPDGTAIMQFDLSSLHNKHGQHSRCVPRSDLHAHLANHLAPNTLSLAAQAKSVTWTENDASVTLSDGTTQTSDLVIVADGQNSTLRAQILGQDALRSAGYGAILGLADMWSTPPGWGKYPEACEYYGPNGRFGVFKSGPNQTYWFFVSTAVPEGAQAKAADPDWLIDQLRDWPAFTRDLVANTPQDRMPQVAFNDRAPAPHWGNGRVLLAGDAAHPMLPNFGQGANQAIEDAFAIGQGLAQHKIGADLASFYVATRKKKAESIVAQNRQNGRLVQQENRFGQMLRNTMMRKIPNWAIQAQLDRHFSLA